MIAKNKSGVALILLLSFFILSFVSAKSISLSSNLSQSSGGISLITPPNLFPPNNSISVNSSTFWDTLDHGPLGYVSDLMHNWLGGLQGGTSGEYYHLTGAQHSYIGTNLYNFLTGANLSYIGTSLNHSDLQELAWSQAGHYIDTNVSFNNYSIYNVSVINATTGYFADLFVENNSIYVGDQIKISAGGVGGGILNITGGNVSADVYFGSGKYLTDLNLTNISFAGDTINASQFNGNFTGNFFGEYDWQAETPYLYFNRTYLDFNETKLSEQTEVKLISLQTNISTSGGSGSAITSIIDFEIKEIIVTPASPSSQYRFQATESTSGNIIDKDRMLHTGVWDIEKNYPINNTVVLNITSSNPAAETYTVTIKYLDNFV